MNTTSDISIHRPLAGPDDCGVELFLALVEFQSTGPSRGPTVPAVVPVGMEAFQSTGPSRGPTATTTSSMARLTYFNPQAPRGARPGDWGDFLVDTLFQSTGPSRGPTQC